MVSIQPAQIRRDAAESFGIDYRLYTEAHASRLAFFLHCRNLDIALHEIRSLPSLCNAPAQDCGE